MSHHTAGKWNEYLATSNTEKLWNEVHRIVAKHKLSRYSSKFDNLVDEGSFNKFTDLTQELFTKLLEKDRFSHYISTGMSDAEIELEISQIELTNLLTLDLRKRYPESYRMSLRILQILKNSLVFKKYNSAARVKVSDQIYGLHKWDSNVQLADSYTLSEKLALIPHYPRDLRHFGCSDDTQLIISNPDLEQLIVKIFEAVGSLLTVKQIRQYTMSKLSILDITLSPIQSGGVDDDQPDLEISDSRPTPFENLVASGLHKDLELKVTQLLDNLWDAAKHKTKQYDLLKDILKHYYVGEANLNQWEVSKLLGVSDATVSGYRKIIENSLQHLGFTSIEEAKLFKQLLSANLNRL